MKKVKICGWEGYELTDGKISVGLTPCIGGRIMSLVYQGQELLFVDPSKHGQTFDPSTWHNLAKTKEQLGFNVWGGDKTWIAPQSQWLMGIPPLDLDAAPYSVEFIDGQVFMCSPICRETGLQIQRTVGLKDGKIELKEEIFNRSQDTKKVGLWNVTQLKHPCQFLIPAQSGDIRSYHHEDNTLPVYLGDLDAVDRYVRVDCPKKGLFKVGGTPSQGEVIIKQQFGPKEIVWKKVFNFERNGIYAHGSVVEVFNSHLYDYAEIELHASQKILSPGEVVNLSQVWHFGQ